MRRGTLSVPTSTRRRLDAGRAVSTFIVQAFYNEPITIYIDGNQTQSFYYVDDMITAFVTLMATPADVTRFCLPLPNCPVRGSSKKAHLIRPDESRSPGQSPSVISGPSLTHQSVTEARPHVAAVVAEQFATNGA